MKQVEKKECRNKVHCNVFAFCCTSEEENLHCWEMAEQQNDFHFQYNVCRDCFVFLHVDESSPLTQRDIDQILVARASAAEGDPTHH